MDIPLTRTRWAIQAYLSLVGGFSVLACLMHLNGAKFARTVMLWPAVRLVWFSLHWRRSLILTLVTAICYFAVLLLPVFLWIRSRKIGWLVLQMLLIAGHIAWFVYWWLTFEMPVPR